MLGAIGSEKWRKLQLLTPSTTVVRTIELLAGVLMRVLGSYARIGYTGIPIVKVMRKVKNSYTRLAVPRGSSVYRVSL